MAWNVNGWNILKVVCRGCKRELKEHEWKETKITRCPHCGSMMVEITSTHFYRPEEDYD